MTKQLEIVRRIWVYKYLVDMRKQIDGLCILVSEHMNMNPQSGDIYLFFSYAADRVKVLFWDGSGFVLVYKRLEVGCFAVPGYIGKHLRITKQQLSKLLQGTITNPGLEFNAYY